MCRLHRPGQEKKVTIDFWVYGTDPTQGNNANNQLQALGMAVMSDKVRASAVVSGSVGAGLAALNQPSSDIMTTLRDLLLNETVDTTLATPAMNTEAGAIVSKAQGVDPRYAWIEAEIERYDDLRKPITLPAPLIQPVRPMVETVELPIWSLTTSTALEQAPPEPLPTVVSASEAPSTAADPIPDVLLALAAEFGGTMRIISNTPDLFKPTQAVPPKTALKKRRAKFDITRAPADTPVLQMEVACPEVVNAPLKRISPGLQIPLF